MCLSNIDNVAAYLNEQREMETEEARPSMRSVREGFQLADQIYAAAMNAKPKDVADAVLAIAHGETDIVKRALLREAAVMVLQYAHYRERAREMEKKFGSIQ